MNHLLVLLESELLAAIQQMEDERNLVLEDPDGSYRSVPHHHNQATLAMLEVSTRRCQNRLSESRAEPMLLAA